MGDYVKKKSKAQTSPGLFGEDDFEMQENTSSHQRSKTTFDIFEEA